MSSIKLKGNGSISADREIINKNFISIDENLLAIEDILNNNLVETTSDKISNLSNVTGASITEALNTLNAPTVIEAATKLAGSTGTSGQMAYDALYLYTCVSTDTWIRTPITAW
jgi:hypothetical protein